MSEGKMVAQRQLNNGKWVDARPISGSLILEMVRRVKECWLVLTNQARAVKWY